MPLCRASVLSEACSGPAGRCSSIGAGAAACAAAGRAAQRQAASREGASRRSAAGETGRVIRGSFGGVHAPAGWDGAQPTLAKAINGDQSRLRRCRLPSAAACTCTGRISGSSAPAVSARSASNTPDTCSGPSVGSASTIGRS
ncbi:hypothetical protein G6F23_014945 [Rhizopus arrhizus]|nr:hypothetical protein G6F23_014945 [Rhizopus arrhizus]